MEKITLDSESINRLKLFLSSKFYDNLLLDDISRSDYWVYESSLSNTSIIDEYTVSVSGNSGYYIPENKINLFKLIKKAITFPGLIIPKLINLFVKKYLRYPLFISYEKSFNYVMSHNIISEPVLSRYRINFKLSTKKTLYLNSETVRINYHNYSKKLVNDHIYSAYYFYNILEYFDIPKTSSRFLEIGGGTGNLVSVIKSHTNNSKFILVDLPSTLSNAYVFLKSIFPTETFLLPNEITALDHNSLELALSEVTFTFLTPDQINLIPNDYCDLATNTFSFQEMTPQQISIYFNLIQRVIKDGGHFFTVNRVEKIPSNENPFSEFQNSVPLRFYEYPWNVNNINLVDEISRFHRLVQADNCAIRLQKVLK